MNQQQQQPKKITALLTSSIENNNNNRGGSCLGQQQQQQHGGSNSNSNNNNNHKRAAPPSSMVVGSPYYLKKTPKAANVSTPGGSAGGGVTGSSMSSSIPGGPGGGGSTPTNASMTASSPSHRGEQQATTTSYRSSTSIAGNHSGGGGGGNRVWVQQEAIDAIQNRQSIYLNSNGGQNAPVVLPPSASLLGKSLRSSSGNNNSASNSLSGSFARRTSFSSLGNGNSNNNGQCSSGPPSETESCCDGASRSSSDPNGNNNGQRQLTWKWKSGCLVENCSGGGVVVRLDDAEGMNLPVEDAPDGCTIRLGPNAFQDGHVVHSNDYVVDAEGNVQPPSDLITLTHLHEPSVVESLRYRYETNQIYTNTGPVLLALNPFQTVRGMYGEGTMRRYWDKAERGTGVELPPHVYAIADASFRNMMRKLEDDVFFNAGKGGKGVGVVGEAAGVVSADIPLTTMNQRMKGCNQSILVSGESGAGKTVTTKFVMKYLAALSQRSAALNKPEKRAYLKVAEGNAADGSGGGCGDEISVSVYVSGSASPRPFSPSGGAGKAKRSSFQQPSWAVPASSSSSSAASSSTSSTKKANSLKASKKKAAAGRSPATPTIRKQSSTVSATSQSSLSSNHNGSNNDALSSVTLLSGTMSNSIEAQVLQSNPILESFGNARTVRNDNSSRFGKFIEIQFTRTGQLVGANIDTYLLEKVRLVSQAGGERNYHVFYEFLAGTDTRERSQYFLASTASPEDFKMTASGTYHRRDGVSDTETFRQLRQAMETMKFSKPQMKEIWNVVAALLHASNLTFVELPGDESGLDDRNVHLHPVCQLLGVQPEDLEEALCSCSILAGNQSLKRAMNKPKAEKGLEALLKATYGALFELLVRRINASISYKEPSSSDSHNDSDEENHEPRQQQDAGDGSSPTSASGPSSTVNRPAASIGVLDIFGFESFHTNSFEQLCINYCNEALQQQFNAFVLKNEQAEYEREGIEWSFIEFPENQDVLDLIEKRGTGILSILDDQCRAPGPSDKAFALDVYKTCKSQPRFMVSRKQQATLQFSVQHYAGPVEYTTSGFTEKNRDELPKEACELLRNSKVDFMQQLADILEQSRELPADTGPGATPTKRLVLHRADSSVARASVGGQFRRQLRNLRNKIDVTTPHYVRCLKPNDLLVPDHFDSAVVAEQLRCGGILEAVRVARAGFTQHYPHADFIRRYRALAWRELGKKEVQRQKQNPATVSGGWTNGRPSTGGRGSSGSYLNGYMHSIQKTKSETKAEMSPADAKILCKDLIKVLYRKIYQLAKEDGNEIEGIPASPRDMPSPCAKAKTYSFSPLTPTWSRSSSGTKKPTTESPLPPVPTSAGSIKSRYPFDKKDSETKKEVTSPSPPSTASTTTSSWKRGGLTSSDYAKVGIQMGKTKVFLRHKAFEALERIRSREQTKAGTKLNSMFRRYLARIAYIPYRDAFRRGLAERRRQFEEGGEDYKESKEQDYYDGHYGDDGEGGDHFRNAYASFHRGGNFATDSLVDKWMASKIRDAIHNPVPRSEWGKQAPTKEDEFKWILMEGIWVRKYE